MTAAQLLPLIRELFSKLPEMRGNAPWELQSALYVLGYTDELESEGEINAALKVARTDWTGRAA